MDAVCVHTRKDLKKQTDVMHFSHGPGDVTSPKLTWCCLLFLSFFSILVSGRVQVCLAAVDWKQTRSVLQNQVRTHGVRVQ